MTLEEYTEKIDSAVTAPDTAAATLAEVKENIKTDLATLDSLKTAVDEKDKKIQDLQETNLKLYMSMGSTPDKDDDEPEDKIPEDIGKDRADAIADSFGKSYYEDKYVKGE